MVAIGTILRIDQAGNQQVYNPTADTKEARGARLVEAFDDSSAGETLIVCPGDYWMEDDQPLDGTGLTIFGSGETTYLKFETQGASQPIRLKYGAGSIFRDFRVECRSSDDTTVGQGLIVGSQDNTGGTINPRLLNIRIESRDDAIYEIGNHTSNLYLERCTLRSGWDQIVWIPSGAGSTIEVNNCYINGIQGYGGATAVGVTAASIGGAADAQAIWRGGRINQINNAVGSGAAQGIVMNFGTLDVDGTKFQASGQATGSKAPISAFNDGYHTGTVSVTIGPGTSLNPDLLLLDSAVAFIPVFAPTYKKVNLAAATQTLKPTQSGQRFVGAVDAVFTLPAASAETKGVWYEFECGALSSGTGLAISPASVDHIRGNGLTAVDNKDLINSGATDRLGDSVTLYCDGADGWVIAHIIGTWAKQP